MVSSVSNEESAKKIEQENKPERLELSADWDNMPHIDDEDHYGKHVVRKRERDLLVDFLIRKKEGALLICGKRGVGKTSLVFSAIQEARRIENENLKAKKDVKRLLPILVDAPSFGFAKVDEQNGKSTDAKSGDNNHEKLESADFKRLVLQSIVRRLYQVTKELDKSGKKIKTTNIDGNPLPRHSSFFRTKSESQTSRVVVQSKIKDRLCDYLEISELFTKAIATEVKKQPLFS